MRKKTNNNVFLFPGDETFFRVSLIPITIGKEMAKQATVTLARFIIGSDNMIAKTNEFGGTYCRIAGIAPVQLFWPQ